jgi:hypothetical protein
MAAMTHSAGDALELLTLAREGARVRRILGITWGCTIRTDRITEQDVESADDPLLGEVALKACTLGGEELWLTSRLANTLPLVFVQGECRGTVFTDVSAPMDEPLAELRILMTPAPSTEHWEGALRLETSFQAGESSTLVLLCQERPAGWPP